MNYRVNLKALDNSFKVPNELADNFIKSANPKHIIVLLWALRHAETPKSADEIAEKLQIEKSVVREAIFYWIDNGFIIPEGANVSAPDAPKAKPKAKKEAKVASPSHKLGSSMASDEEVLKRAEESAEFRYLLHKSQEVFGRTISKAERSMLLTLMDYYGLPAEVLLMLITYAVSAGRTGTNYIQTVGMSWAEEGIDTLEAAESKIAQLNKTNRLWSAFQRQADIPLKNPTKKQEAFFIKWTGEWNMSIELIAYGYEKMIDAIDKANYKYLDKMLCSWHEAGAYTIDKVEALEAEKAGSKKVGKKQEEQNSFSTSSFEDFVMNNELKYKKEEG